MIQIDDGRKIFDSRNVDECVCMMPPPKQNTGHAIRRLLMTDDGDMPGEVFKFNRLVC